MPVQTNKNFIKILLKNREFAMKIYNLFNPVIPLISIISIEKRITRPVVD